MTEKAEKRPLPERCSYKGEVLAVMTSGGDAPGMNAAIRACIRTAIYLGCKTYFIREGYKGMVEGGCHIMRANWASVSSIIHRSGTIIGSARSTEFRERSGRLKAAYNLVKKGITNLVIIGGDGSLTGANLLRHEWSSLLEELRAAGQITDQLQACCRSLKISGVIGSIDNDFCGSDYTIGTDSALHRISEAANSLIDTAESLQRIFIIEVMGRMCGYLSLVSGIITEADWVFSPEIPPPNDWPEKLCAKITEARKYGQRLNLVILSEGAVDLNGAKITGDIVMQEVSTRLQVDARVSVLGHVQRGGNPTAIDRIQGCRMGAEATLAVLESLPDSEAMVIVLIGNQLFRLPLNECIEKINAVHAAYDQKNWDAVVELRGPTFRELLDTYKLFSQLSMTAGGCPCQPRHTVAVMHIGEPACGMNATVHSFVRHCIHSGENVLGIYGGIDGLLACQVKPLRWTDVTGWIIRGGAELGTKLTLPDGKFDRIAQHLRELNIKGLLIVGGFEGYLACIQFYEQRVHFPEFRIPIVLVPATMSNNVPGCDIAVGSDTSLNMVTMILDCLRQSANSTNHRVFIVETFGGYCGYLATLGALASGADSAYIFEEKFGVKDLHEDVCHMASKMAEGVKRGLVLRSESANENYDTDFIRRLYAEEGRRWFSCRMNKIGHTQQGGHPTPYDRLFGIEMAAKAHNWLKEQINGNQHDHPDSVCVLGYVRSAFKFTPVTELIPNTLFDKRLPKCQWWLKLRPLMRILSKHVSAYSEAVEVPPTDIKCSVN